MANILLSLLILFTPSQYVVRGASVSETGSHWGSGSGDEGEEQQYLVSQ